MIEIEVCERMMDCWYDYDNGAKRMPKYHAQIKGKGGYWGCGRTRNQAIGSVVVSHPETFGVKLNVVSIQIGEGVNFPVDYMKREEEIGELISVNSRLFGIDVMHFEQPMAR